MWRKIINSWKKFEHLIENKVNFDSFVLEIFYEIEYEGLKTNERQFMIMIGLFAGTILGNVNIDDVTGTL